MDFWKSVTEAAEKAKDVARVVSQKGLELAESTREEAEKKLKEFNLHEKVGAGVPQQSPNPEELQYYGITDEFQEFIRTLNYSTFRDFPSEHLSPLQADAPAEDPSAPQKLNPWQAQHAKLVIQAVQEVNELRFVLCPRYMTDEHFWHVYFTLVKKYLPEKAFSWTEQDALPAFAGSSSEAGGGVDDLFSLSGLGSQLKQLGSRIQQTGLSLAGAAGGAAEGSSVGTPGAGSGAAAAAAGTVAAAPSPKDAGGLEADPDLEAYLQVAVTEGKESGDAEVEDGEYEGGEGEGEEEDLDLDSYINELSAEVEAADDEEPATK